MEEIWWDIPDYKGIYQISNFGRIKRLESYDSRGFLRKERIRRQTANKDGYMVVGLYKQGKEKKFLVHQLVAQAFIPNPNNYAEINHKDENKKNNIFSNLEWCSRKYNVNYGLAQTKRLISWRQRKGGKILCVEKNC